MEITKEEWDELVDILHKVKKQQKIRTILNNQTNSLRAENKVFKEKEIEDGPGGKK